MESDVSVGAGHQGAFPSERLPAFLQRHLFLMNALQSGDTLEFN
jgi:hypothetical protein